MNAISFILSGKTACFRKPDVNQHTHFTYSNIHKPALLGLLGAIIGLGGYTKLFDKNSGFKKGKLGYDDGFPEFYEKLKHLKVSITPLSKNGYFSKKTQTFNNSVGYASFEQGGNLIVREQWLENPKWQIMILKDESKEYEKIKKYLEDKKCIFVPYLGKNEHPAKISNVKMVQCDSKLYLQDGLYVDSLFIKNGEIDGYEKEGEIPFVFQESSPISFQKDYHFYENKFLCFTNCELEEIPENTFSYKNKNYTFI